MTGASALLFPVVRRNVAQLYLVHGTHFAIVMSIVRRFVVLLFALSASLWSRADSLPLKVVSAPDATPLLVLTGFPTLDGDIAVFEIDSGAPISLLYEPTSAPNVSKSVRARTTASESLFSGDPLIRAEVSFRMLGKTQNIKFAEMKAAANIPGFWGLLGLNWLTEKSYSLDFGAYTISENADSGKLDAGIFIPIIYTRLDKTPRLVMAICDDSCGDAAFDTGVAFTDLLHIEPESIRAGRPVVNLMGVQGVFHCLQPKKGAKAKIADGTVLSDLYESTCFVADADLPYYPRKIFGIRSLIESHNKLIIDANRGVIRILK